MTITTKKSKEAKHKKTAPRWSDVKAKLIDFDHAGLLGLVQDLYAASKDNQTFLHARFGLGDDALQPYKTTIERWLYPNVYKNQEISVAKAKKALSDYKKAIGRPEGLAELMVFYCEQAAWFSDAYGYQDEGYFVALVRMYSLALETIANLQEAQRQPLWERLKNVRGISHSFGYGVGDHMNDSLDQFGVHD